MTSPLVPAGDRRNSPVLEPKVRAAQLDAENFHGNIRWPAPAALVRAWKDTPNAYSVASAMPFRRTARRWAGISDAQTPGSIKLRAALIFS